MLEAFYIIAQTTQPTHGGNIEITIPAAITIAGVLATIGVVIKLGDRLWGKEKKEKDDKKDDVLTCVREMNITVQQLQSHCERCNERLTDNLGKLSDAMTKYIELQQAALKVEEYRHESLVKQFEVLIGRVDENIKEVDKKRSDDIKSIHNRLDSLLTNILNSKHKP